MGTGEFLVAGIVKGPVFFLFFVVFLIPRPRPTSPKGIWIWECLPDFIATASCRR